MPRIPTIQSEQGIPVLNLPRPGPEFYGAEVGKGLETLGKTLDQIAESSKRQQDAIDFNKLSGEYDANLLDLREEVKAEPVLGENDYVTRHELYNKKATDLQKGLLSRTQSREVQAALQAHFGKQLPRHLIQVKYDALAEWNKQRLADLDVEAQTTADQIVKETEPQEIARKTAQFEGMVVGMSQGPHAAFDVHKAEQIITTFNKTVRIARAKQDAWYDPLGFLERLHTTEFSDLTADETRILSSFAETRLRQIETAQRVKEAADERETKRVQEVNYSGLINRIAKGEDVSVDLERMGPSGTREISVDQQLRAMELNMTPRNTLDRPSNPLIYNPIALDVHGTSPTTTEGQIDRLVGRGLNIKDALALKDRLVINREKMASNPDLTRRHNQAEQLLTVGLTTRSPFEALDPVSQKLKQQALMELTRRSSLFDGKEDPLAVIREILPIYQLAFEDEAKLEETNIRKILRFRNPQELEAARGRISLGEYESQRKLFLDLDKRIQERLAIEARRKTTGK